MFSKYLKAEVIGTELLETEDVFTIQWDFHNTKYEWLNNIDFIYSNALDHSHTPSDAVKAWMSCLSTNGVCCIEHTKFHRNCNQIDCFGANRDEYRELFSKYNIEELEINDKRRTVIFILSNKGK